MAGVGKSTLGRALAAKLGWDFIDIDVDLKRRTGKTLQQTIEEQGEGTLLRMEKQRILEIELNRKVISPGGSIIYDPELMAYLKESACLVYLDDAFENIEKRISNARTRGIIGLKSKTLAEIYLERQPLYAGYADILIDLRKKTSEEAVAGIIEHLNTQACKGI